MFVVDPGNGGGTNACNTKGTLTFFIFFFNGVKNT